MKRLETKDGATIKWREDGFEIIARDEKFKEMQRHDIYIKGLVIKLTEEERIKLRELI